MHPLSQIIASIQRRLVWRRRAMAACWILATAIAAALVLGVADYLTRLSDPGLRVMATAALMASVAWAAYRWWYLPLQQRLVPLAVARRVESQFPQLRDSLASAIEFLRQPEDDKTAGSAQLRRLVIAEAHNKIASLPLDDVIERGPLRKAAASLAVAILIAVLCLAVDAGAVRTALARLAAPLGGTQWPRQHQLVFRKVPTQLAAGQTFEVELVDTAGALPDDARIEYSVLRNGDREVTSEPMVRAGDAMIARRANVSQSFAFRAKGGDDDTMTWNWVEVKEPPQLASLAITVHPPAYTGIPATRAERHLEVLAGTGIEVNGTTSEPIRAARILLDRGQPIEAVIQDDAAGNERRALHIAPQQWIASQGGPYKLELVNANGLAGFVGQWNLRVDPDLPPSVTWQRPSDDLFVLPRAAVPIEVLVKDDLAIQRVVLAYDRTDKSESERARRPQEPPIELYRGPEKPPAPLAQEGSTRGESRVVKYAWNLATLEIPSGAVLTIQAEASDYRPGVGRTIGPRRITIINAEEFDRRLAERQLQIVRQLERALAIQRKTREDVQRVEIQLHDAGALTKRDRDTLQTAEPNQRSVGRMLVDPAEGVTPLVDAILDEIEINRLANSEMRDSLNRLSDELKRLSSGPLSVAERELTSARKAVESITTGKDLAENITLPMNAQQTESMSRSLAAVVKGQDDITATLDRLVSELSGKADVRRFARLIAELRDDQLAHEKSARAEIDVETLPLDVNELSRLQRATLNKAVAGQTAIAGRFTKIEQGMDQLARQLSDANDPAAGTVTDAVELSHKQAIGTNMQQTATDLSENRVGRALERESKIAEDLQQLLNVLRNEGERRPQQLADSLKQAGQRLAVLQQQLAGLRQQIAQAEQAPNAATPAQQRQLGEQQQNMKRDIERLARDLDRLQAADASQSTKSAANQLNNGAPNAKQGGANAQQPSSSNQVQKAEEDLQRASQQLAERRQQAEDDLAVQFVRRFQTELTEMVHRQQQVIKKTVELDAARKGSPALSAEQIKIISDLAQEENRLADQAKMHSDLLFGLAPVRVSLEEAERRLGVAGKLLGERQTGQQAQSAEQLALARLEGMMRAFAQTASDASQKPNANGAPPAGANNNQPQQPQRRPTFELLEVKMLRMLQADLNDRTRQHEQRMAEAAGNQAAKAGLDQEARELAAEQGRLAELVQKMVTRDNEKQER
jgi:hypothetical protein